MPVSAEILEALECLDDLEALESLDELEEAAAWGGSVERNGRAGGPRSLECLDDLEALESLNELEEVGCGAEAWSGTEELAALEA